MAVRGSVPRTRWEEEEAGRATSIRSEKSESGLAAAMGASGADAEFCLTLRAPRTEKSVERPSEGGFEVLRARMALSRAGAVRRMDMETDRKA